MVFKLPYFNIVQLINTRFNNVILLLWQLQVLLTNIFCFTNVENTHVKLILSRINEF